MSRKRELGGQDERKIMYSKVYLRISESVIKSQPAMQHHSKHLGIQLTRQEPHETRWMQGRDQRNFLVLDRALALAVKERA